MLCVPAWGVVALLFMVDVAVVVGARSQQVAQLQRARQWFVHAYGAGSDLNVMRRRCGAQSFNPLHLGLSIAWQLGWIQMSN